MTREYLEGGILGALLILTVNFLFYRRWWVTFPLIPLGVYAARMHMKSRLDNKKRQQRSEFREALSCLSVSLRAGYSVENAIRETAKDLANILGPEADMTREFAYIYSQLLVSVPVEALLLDFAARDVSISRSTSILSLMMRAVREIISTRLPPVFFAAANTAANDSMSSESDLAAKSRSSASTGTETSSCE